jgi:hypothetical protein
MSQENVEVVRQLVEGRWKADQFEPLEYIDGTGDLVVFVARLVTRVTAPPGFVPRVWIVFRVNEGKVVEWHPHQSEEAARKAAGLSE